MTHSLLLLPWLLPLLLLVLGITYWRLSISRAALAALSAACVLAFLASPVEYSSNLLMQALLRGSWIGINIAPYILGGILFRQAAAHTSNVASQFEQSPLAQRRRIFLACFLIGPFAEAATGFGVGMLGTVAYIRVLRLRPQQVAIFALLSQTFIPWGAMGSGTLLAAAYARLPASEMALYTGIPTALLMLVWLPLYWRTLRLAGLASSVKESCYELIWISCSLLLLVTTSAYIGPETSLLAVFGLLIVLRYCIDQRPPRHEISVTLRKVLPHIAIISALLLSRLHPNTQHLLQSWGRWQVYSDLPAWSPLYHAGSILILGAVVCCVIRHQLYKIPALTRYAWRTGHQAVISIFFFAMLAEVMSNAGISELLANSLYHHLAQQAVLLSTLLASALGILTNSGNMPNSLLMSAQVSLATHAGLHPALIAGLLHGAGTCLSFFSPIRLSIACALSEQIGQERQTYQVLLPYAALAIGLILLLALVLS